MFICRKLVLLALDANLVYNVNVWNLLTTLNIMFIPLGTLQDVKFCIYYIVLIDKQLKIRCMNILQTWI